MSNNPIQNTSIIKVSIAAIAIVLAAISIQPVKADTDKSPSSSLFSLTTNLTSKVDYNKMAVEPAPGWVKMSNKEKEFDCQKNLYSGQILCENQHNPKVELKAVKLQLVKN
jgi:hypothetical protein